ncbi:hypothetical protein E3J62_12645 [candidate division TA06 bacterium]|uniref:Translocation and assembly module TamB C-terminal domain-containing protein n=1 Tax=candidate division TA06 bacterium TaxID=2250710 RepID=A0A523UME2_UNCT6|nr:MAG: hypothetical protein E3J62_12645 [candidate division TA06 bacterium]
MSRKRQITYVVTIALAMLFLLAHLILGTEWALNRVVNHLVRRIETSGINVDVRGVAGTLLGEIKLSGIEIAPAGEEKPIIWADSLAVSYSPIALVVRRRLTSIMIHGPGLSLKKENGKWNLSGLLNRKEPSASEAKPTPQKKPLSAFPFSIAHMIVLDGAMSIQGDRNIAVSDANLFCSLLTKGNGTTIRLYNGKFTVNGRLRVFRLFGEAALGEMGLELKEFQLRTRRSRIAVAGKVDSTGTHIVFLDSKVNVEEFADILQPELGLKGDMTISGTYSESLDVRTVNARMLVAGAQIRGIDLGRLDLLASFDGPQGRLKINRWQIEKGFATGSILVDMTPTIPVFSVDCQLDSFDPGLLLDRRVVLTGNLNLTGSGNSLENVTATGKARLNQTSLDGITLSRAISDFSYSSGTIKLDTLDVTFERGRFISSGRLSRTGFELDSKMENMDVATFGPVLGINDLKGSLSGYLWMEGTVSNPSLSGTAWIADGEFKGLRFDHLGANLNIQDMVREPKGSATISFAGVALNDTRVEQGKIELVAEGKTLEYEVWATADEGSLNVRGNAFLKDGSAEAEADNFFLVLNDQIIKNSSVLSVVYSDSGLFIRPCTLDFLGSEMSFGGLNLNNGHTEFNLRADSVRLSSLTAMLTSKPQAEGFLTVDFKLNGTLEDPQMALLLDLRSMSIAQASVDSSIISLSYAKNLLKTEKFIIYRNERKSTLSGYIPVNLAIRSEGPRILESDMSLDADFNDVGVWIFFPLRNLFEVAEGRVDAKINVRGTPHNPNITGTMNVSSPRVLFRPTLTSATDVVGKLKLEGERLDVVSVSGKTKGGSVDVNGYLVFEALSYKDYEFNVKARNALVEGFKDVSAVVNADAVVRRGKDMIHTECDVEVIQSTLTVPFRTRAIPLAASKHNASYDLTIHGDRNIFLSNRDADLEMGADVRVRWRPGTMVLSGVMDIVGGRFYYLGFTQPFDVKTGEFRFSNAPELNPSVDVEAEAIVIDPFKPLDPDSNKVLPDIITLTVAGTMLEPEFHLSSPDPELSETDLLLLLSLGFTTGRGSNGNVSGQELIAKTGGDLSLAVLQNIVMRELERTTGLHEIRFKSELFGPERSARLTVGKYVRKGVYVSYSHDLFAGAKDEYKVEYYLWKGSSVVGSRDEEGRYNLGLGFKVRY